MIKRALKVALATALIILAAGCGVLNPKVEFGQKEVPKFPDRPEKLEESLRDAAWQAAKISTWALDRANAAGRQYEEVRPLEELVLLTGSISTSVGPPRSLPRPFIDTPLRISERLVEQTAAYQSKVNSFAADIEDLEGKDVEGTGFIQTTQWTIIFVLIVAGFILTFVWRVLNTVAMTANPAVGMGMSAVGGVVKFGAGKLQQAFQQVLKGGERFKDRILKEVEEEKLDTKAAEAILRLFREEHERAQDEATQASIRELTRKE